LAVRVVGRADIDRLDVRRFHQPAPVALHALPSPTARKGLRFVARAPRHRLEHGLISHIEELIHTLVSVRMSPAHKAVAHHSDVQWLGHWISLHTAGWPVRPDARSILFQVCRSGGRVSTPPAEMSLHL